MFLIKRLSVDECHSDYHCNCTLFSPYNDRVYAHSRVWIMTQMESLYAPGFQSCVKYQEVIHFFAYNPKRVSKMSSFNIKNYILIYKTLTDKYF